MIDRVAPTRRPDRKVRGYQNWRSLLFMHWRVPQDVLRRLVPSSLELDLYNGEAYVGVVPFAMSGVRPKWLPAAFGFQFLETNVRTYVTYRNRPGVYFLSLDAAYWPAVWAARTFWGLPYFHAEMSMSQSGDEVTYRTVRRRDRSAHEVRYRIGKALGESKGESLEFFFLERYLLFVERHGRILTGQVSHTPYPAHAAEVVDVRDDLLAVAGIPGGETAPALTHYSPGVDVEVFSLEGE